jgi:hypothetical protein
MKEPRVECTAWPESSPFDGIIRVRFKGSFDFSRTSQPVGSPACLVKDKRLEGWVNSSS